jgi:hypothetical protein
MELNRLVFPSPQSSYTHNSLPSKILYVPKFELYKRRGQIEVDEYHKSKINLYQRNAKYNNEDYYLKGQKHTQNLKNNNLAWSQAFTIDNRTALDFR